MLIISDLSFDYEQQALLNEVNLTLGTGELLHLRGINGVGKSTLLRLISGLIQPLQGDICYQASSIYEDLLRYQQHLTFISHRSGLSAFLTVREHIHYHLYASHQSSIDEALDTFGLLSLIDEPIAYLSVGQKRRLALLRLQLQDTALWLLDEPLVALDELGVDCLVGCLNDHLTRGGQVVMTSHQVLPEALHCHQEYCLL